MKAGLINEPAFFNSIAMKEFMIVVSLPEVFSPRFMSLIPDQRKTVSALLKEGIIICYALSLERSKLWITMSAEDIEDVQKQLNKFPLARYMKSDIIELMFQQSATFILPEPSLN